MIRLAVPEDAQQLYQLNEEFNGEDETTLDNIKKSLADNGQEIVIVAEEKGILAGFICVQVKRSFCYNHLTAEITEAYVKKDYRKRGFASGMLSFAEKYCSEKYPLHQFELLTGKDNFTAQSVYNRLGYREDGEIHLSKRAGGATLPIQ